MELSTGAMASIVGVLNLFQVVLLIWGWRALKQAKQGWVDAKRYTEETAVMYLSERDVYKQKLEVVKGLEKFWRDEIAKKGWNYGNSQDDKRDTDVEGEAGRGGSGTE